ncbi:hypothetical protein CEXT_49941 [Caerostris extrusa]|uniref:Uncharacterized protein n=1 Tax=Caerostris extrusa TaxID=172846 RepID=A0AAV4QPK5_CAEEX|nr:hypothetical protein CEXT_49941 [Caerostris extrusa]
MKLETAVVKFKSCSPNKSNRSVSNGRIVSTFTNLQARTLLDLSPQPLSTTILQVPLHSPKRWNELQTKAIANTIPIQYCPALIKMQAHSGIKNSELIRPNPFIPIWF